MQKVPTIKPKEIRAQFYQQIGQCITTWAWIEEELFQICHAALGCRRKQAAIVFGRTPTMDTRLALIDELLRSVFPKTERDNGGHDPKIIKEWSRIHRELSDLESVRNAIAHRPVAQVVTLHPFQRQEFYKYLDSLEVGECLYLQFTPKSDPSPEMTFSLPRHSHLRENRKKVQEIKGRDLDIHIDKLRAAGKQLSTFLKETRAMLRKGRAQQAPQKLPS